MVVQRTLAALSLGLVLSSGALLGQGLPNGGPPPASGPVINEAPKVPDSIGSGAGMAVDPKSYVIGAEDLLNIQVWREPDFSRGVAVRPDGKITMPLVGDVQAEGLTPERLSAQLTQALGDIINQPLVTVSLIQVNSKKFYISGLVNRPGSFPLVTPITVFDALNQAGGFQTFANLKKIVIVRGAKQRLEFNYSDYLKGKGIDRNVFLQNGDTVIVK